MQDQDLEDGTPLCFGGSVTSGLIMVSSSNFWSMTIALASFHGNRNDFQNQ
jgi:hypothetical protein